MSNQQKRNGPVNNRGRGATQQQSNEKYKKTNTQSNPPRKEQANPSARQSESILKQTQTSSGGSAPNLSNNAPPATPTGSNTSNTNTNTNTNVNQQPPPPTPVQSTPTTPVKKINGSTTTTHEVQNSSPSTPPHTNNSNHHNGNVTVNPNTTPTKQSTEVAPPSSTQTQGSPGVPIQFGTVPPIAGAFPPPPRTQSAPPNLEEQLQTVPPFRDSHNVFHPEKATTVSNGIYKPSYPAYPQGYYPNVQQAPMTVPSQLPYGYGAGSGVHMAMQQQQQQQQVYNKKPPPTKRLLIVDPSTMKPIDVNTQSPEQKPKDSPVKAIEHTPPKKLEKDESQNKKQELETAKKRG